MSLLGGITNTATSTTSSLVGSVGDTLSNTTGIVGGTIGSTVGTVGQTVDAVGQTVSDAGQAVTKIDDKMGDFDESIDPPKPNEINKWIVNKPIGAARVWSGRHLIYSRTGDEAMYGIGDRYLTNITWVQLISWRNDTEAEQQYQYAYSTSLKVTKGTEVQNGIDVKGSYNGMSIGISETRKTFSAIETTETQTTTITVKVPAKATLTFYQKRYEFHEECTFVNDAWGKEWNAGPWGGYTPLLTLKWDTQIMADEYLTTDQTLGSGPGLMTCTSVAPAPKADTTRKRENLTERCKNWLNSFDL
ncbi:hypothetical protein CVT24_010164 [Panaeolus cyanescens]|uniref:Uncharacterized protein n=1 Tax=Panaeolus cyanescens TaxID=181874 RepID=A0A409YW39_9AGAR|nr:hypothetical protein CVT24_010164 [Panaeolus cyanescens]